MHQRYHNLQIYKKSIELISELYQFTTELPQSEQFGLISQIRRAGVSISLNIAEGSGSGTDKGFANFLRISLKSIYELMAALEICYKLRYCSKQRAAELYKKLDESAAMISGLIKKLKADS